MHPAIVLKHYVFLFFLFIHMKPKSATYLLFFILTTCCSCWHKKPISAIYLSSKSIAINNVIADTLQHFVLLDSFRNDMDKTMNVVIGNIESDLKKDKPNSTLGNMVCDAMLAKAKTIDAACNIAISNYGGLRISSINKGDITLGKIYELMPFENTISIIPLSGEWIDTICQKIAKAGGMPVSGIQFTMQKNRAINITIDGQALNYSNVYKTCVNSYMAAGGDDCEFLKDRKKQNTTTLIRDAIIDYIKINNQQKTPIIQLPIQRILSNN
jgi:2',3'-cyclic-nucleotide 2'-phosphodiesterase (5'-nucleotidase family)